MAFQVTFSHNAAIILSFYSISFPNSTEVYLCIYFLIIFVLQSTKNQWNRFSCLQDHAKRFMTMKNIPKSMQQRVLRWYRFSRTRGTLTGDNDVNSLEMVPDSLKTELAIFVNLHTLRKVTSNAYATFSVVNFRNVK